MPVRVVADEHIPHRLLLALRAANLDVLSIFEKHRGLTDPEIFALCAKSPSILLTADKAFAAWAVAAHVSQIGVILLRYQRTELDQIAGHLVSLLNTPETLLGTYTVISASKTRHRKIE